MRDRVVDVTERAKAKTNAESEGSGRKKAKRLLTRASDGAWPIEERAASRAMNEEIVRARGEIED